MPSFDPEDAIGPEPEDDRLPDTPADTDLIELVTAHIEENIGPVEVSYHEEASQYVHIDVHFVPAEDEEGAHTYVTSGMSSRPMNVPPDIEGDYRFAELILHLPPDWPTDWATLRKPRNWWPIGAMTNLARLPHERESWVWGGHTLRHGDPPRPYGSDTELCVAMVTPMFLLPEEAEVMRLPGEREVVFHNVAFLYLEEYEFAVAHGSDALLEKVQKAGLTPYEFLVLDKRRRNVVTGSR